MCSSATTRPPTIPTRRFLAATPACASPFCRIACARSATWPTARTASTASAPRKPWPSSRRRTAFPAAAPPPARRCSGSTPRTPATAPATSTWKRATPATACASSTSGSKRCTTWRARPAAATTTPPSPPSAACRLNWACDRRARPPRPCKSGSSPPACRNTAAISPCSAAIPTAAWPTCSAACATSTTMTPTSPATSAPSPRRPWSCSSTRRA